MIARAMRRMLAARKRFVWQHADLGGTTLRLRRSTSVPLEPSPTIILLPGLALSGHYVLPVGAELGRRYPVWIPDLPGYARDLPDRAALDLPELGDLVVRWMDHEGLDSAVLVGNSMGCQVAVEAAARHPERISHIVLEGPTIDAEARSLLRQAGRMFLAGRREPMSLGPLQLIDWVTMGPRGVVATVRYAFAHRPEDRLPLVRCPALVVRGEVDPIVPQRWAERFAAALPLGRLRVVPDTSHALVYSAPRELADIVVGFLSRTAA